MNDPLNGGPLVVPEEGTGSGGGTAESIFGDTFTTRAVPRFNPNTGLWEVEEEPLNFEGIVLTPRAASLVDVEGAMYYNSADKTVMVCTDV